MKYKVGDRVRIKKYDDLIDLSPDGWNPGGGMDIYKNKILTITKIYSRSYYDYGYPDEWGFIFKTRESSRWIFYEKDIDHGRCPKNILKEINKL